MDNRTKKVKHFVKSKVKKHSKKFSLFLIIGCFKAIIVILLNWIAIDILNIWALPGSTMVIIIAFLVTYMMYTKTKVIKPSFLKYTSTTFSFNIAVILAIWFLVDFVGLSGALSSTVIIAIQFGLRYLLLNKIGLIHHE